MHFWRRLRAPERLPHSEAEMTSCTQVPGASSCAPANTRRTGQPVRRNSYHRGEREHLIWRPLGKTKADARRFRGALLKAAKRLDHSTRDPGTRMGALGLSGRAVLEALCEIVDDASGRLEPSIATIAERAALGVRTVVRALKRLRNHGFLSWLRRTEALDNDGAGPQVTQITNAYWFELRGRAAGLVRLMMTGGAPPDQRSSEELQAIDSNLRSERLRAMRHTGPRISASDVISDEVKASLRKLADRRSANALTAKNPGDQV
jgi:hypothetical protein